MIRNARIFGLLVLALAVLAGCSSKPSATDAKKAVQLQKIQGRVQLLEEPGGATDSALNMGGPSLYLWVGAKRYRLFMREPAQLVHGGQYVAEGIDAQKAIDEIGDPDQGKNGYPLQASCERVVRMAWGNLAFDAADAQSTLLRSRIKRYPARSIFLVTRIRQATTEEINAAGGEKKDAAAEKNIQTVSVDAEKQRALLVAGSPVLTAPLWDPAASAAKCKVVIGTDGKISDLETGEQLCEFVPWSEFRYQPPVQGGRPVKVRTEVEIRFEARK